MQQVMERQTRDILTAFLLSILIHLGFLLLSGRVQIGGPGSLQYHVQRAFNVRILPEEELRQLRKPRPDVEAERDRQLRQRIQESVAALPRLSELPPLSIRGELQEAVSQTLDESTRRKLLEQDKAAELPELLLHSVDLPSSIEILKMSAEVGGEEPSVNRRTTSTAPGAEASALPGAQNAMSTLVASRTGPPRIAAPPVVAVPGGPGRQRKPGVLPPKPIIDLSRDVEKPPEVPQLYITPDQEKINQYISLDPFLSVELFVYHLPEDPQGYFLVRIRPNEKSGTLPVMSKDIVFVLDASQSMGNRTMAALRASIILCLSKLRGDDLFEVIGFRRQVTHFREELVPATPANVQQAVRFVNGLEHSGRTDIYGSLEPISRMARGADHPFIILLFSDGRPNVGIVDSRAIINRLTANVRKNSSIFAFGAGDSINRYLLDLLSYRNKGFVDYSTDFTATVSQVEDMFEAISDPLLINLTGDYGNIETVDVYPKTLPDLYRGGEILIYGRYGQEEKFSLRILGEARGEQKEFIIELPFPDTDNGPENLPQLWAFRKIYDLIGQMCQEGESPERLAEIQRISQRYGVRTPYYQ